VSLALTPRSGDDGTAPMHGPSHGMSPEAIKESLRSSI
jgi:hypothetical protein